MKKLLLFDKIVIVLVIIALLFTTYFFFRKSTYVTAIIKVGESDIFYGPWLSNSGTRSWFEQYFYIGMKEKDGLGRTMAEVTKVSSYEISPPTQSVYLTTKLNTVYNRASDQYTFDGKPLVIGSPIKINFENFLVEGLVTYIEGVKDTRSRVNLILETQLKEETVVYPETSGISNYIAGAINIGDEYRDNQGNVITKVIGKKVENAKRLVVTSDGRTLIGTNPLKKDIYLTLSVNAIKIADRYYLLDDVPILVGLGIPLNTSTISLWPEVQKITLANN